MDKGKGSNKKIGDVQAKFLARDRRVVAQILHDYIPEYKDIPTDEIASRYLVGDFQVRARPVMPPLLPSRLTESSIPDEGSVFFDVIIDALAPDTDGKPDSKELIRLIINFDIQNDPTPGYPLPKRAEYYVARMISQQYGVEFTKADYGSLKKVYSVWIVPYAPKSWGNNVLVFPGEHEPKALVGKNHYNRKDYGLWNYILLEVGDPKALQEKRDALGLLSVLFSLTMKPEQRVKTLDERFGFKIDEHEAEELEDMQAMMSISEVYKERMEEEIQDAKEQLRLSEVYKERMEEEIQDAKEQLRIRDQNEKRLEENARHLESELRISNQNAKRLEENTERLESELRQTRAQLAQAVATYIDTGIKRGTDPSELREAVKDLFGIQDAEAMSLIEKAQSKQSSLG